ncbi:hypothetical protein ElyMa_004436800 [Elysia marginata]|uniref:Uncharacterized protein n=1 Tax=Elysia marginata TaxID=1093978 RepID=A0AAV4HDI3_9GAST|nr:hypothetical protein ElyMa_004436800 [Elysia marginata]
MDLACPENLVNHSCALIGHASSNDRKLTAHETCSDLRLNEHRVHLSLQHIIKDAPPHHFLSIHLHTAISMVNAESRFVTEYDTSRLDAIPRARHVPGPGTPETGLLGSLVQGP